MNVCNKMTKWLRLMETLLHMEWVRSVLPPSLHNDRAVNGDHPKVIKFKVTYLIVVSYDTNNCGQSDI